MILGANHVAISVPDMEQGLEFYSGVLGFEKVLDYGWLAGTDVADQILAVKGNIGPLLHGTNHQPDHRAV